LAPVVLGHLSRLSEQYSSTLRVLDLGCGNGAFSARMSDENYIIKASDHSFSGMAIAQKEFPKIEFFQHDINTPLPECYLDSFEVVVSLEVIEHLFQPRVLFQRAMEALGSQGHLIISTPYHGYSKNLALALTNKFDYHWHPLRDFGHIKFFSKSTLLQCVDECGFRATAFDRVGRIPIFAKSMIAVAELRKHD